MSGGYNAKVVKPDEYKIQTESGAFQKPFFFGASQVPTSLMLHPHSFSGSGFFNTNPYTDSNRKTLLLPFHR